MDKIYILERDKIPFYVGKSNNPKKRINKHYNTYGRDITLIVIEEVEEDWKFWECYWIDQLKSWGFNLENKNKGGGGPTKWTNEQKREPIRISKIKNHKTRGNSISKTLLEQNHSKHYTEEIRLKISNSKGGGCINQYDLEGNFIKEWSSIGLLSSYLKEELNLTTKNINTQIRDNCLRKQKTCHGFIFKYKNEGI